MLIGGHDRVIVRARRQLAQQHPEVDAGRRRVGTADRRDVITVYLKGCAGHAVRIDRVEGHHEPLARLQYSVPRHAFLDNHHAGDRWPLLIGRPYRKRARVGRCGRVAKLVGGHDRVIVGARRQRAQQYSEVHAGRRRVGTADRRYVITVHLKGRAGHAVRIDRVEGHHERVIRLQYAVARQILLHDHDAGNRRALTRLPHTLNVPVCG